MCSSRTHGHGAIHWSVINLPGAICLRKKMLSYMVQDLCKEMTLDRVPMEDVHRLCNSVKEKVLVRRTSISDVNGCLCEWSARHLSLITSVLPIGFPRILRDFENLFIVVVTSHTVVTNTGQKKFKGRRAILAH